MKIKPGNVEIVLTYEEAIALKRLLGSLSLLAMREIIGIDFPEGRTLQSMYEKMGEFFTDSTKG